MVSALRIEGLSVVRGRTKAVTDVSVSLDPGLHALLGPNGAGKSSLLLCVAGLVRPAEGAVSIYGVRAGRSRSVRRLPQDNLPKSRFRVVEFLRYMAWLHKMEPATVEPSVSRALEMVNLTESANERVATLSGGMRRRVGIASVLVGEPSVVLLDEPSAGLDVEQRRDLATVLGNIASEAVVVTSTHIIEDVLEVADTVTVMKSGRFLFHGLGSEFTSGHSLKEFERRYLELVA